MNQFYICNLVMNFPCLIKLKRLMLMNQLEGCFFRRDRFPFFFFRMVEPVGLGAPLSFGHCRFGVDVDRAACLLPKTDVKLIGVRNSTSD